MTADDTQFSTHLTTQSRYQELKNRPIAYFCAEYALSNDIPIYAGGLGILAGDYVREAADQHIPLVAVGLYYTEGFTHKELSPEGRVVDLHPHREPHEVGLVPVTDHQGHELRITVPIGDRDVAARAWKWEQGDVSVYLLDTRTSPNTEQDQHITDTLYATDKEIRLKQEIILGIGGLRLLTALGIHPSLYHLNEGHSAFLVYELIHHEMTEHSIDFETAKNKAREHILFTNHTLVAAGNDNFSNDLVALLLSRYAEEIAVPVTTLIDMGLVQQSSSFSMTLLALRTSGKTNAVSQLHATKARDIWTDHPMFPITNGIHIPTWDKVLDETKMREKHTENKRALLTHILEQTGTQWDEKPLILGWARRIVRYKRPLALVERLKQFGEIARSSERPVRVVFAGVSHPADEDGMELLEELQYRLTSDLKGVAVYLPHYNMELARLMTAGCDVWINTPVVGFEACGTSGMKAALNGDLPLTTVDGWVAEVNMYGIGWTLDDTNVADTILDRLRQDILPLYYDNHDEWVRLMCNARELVLNNFSMTHALRRYLEEGLSIKTM